MTALIKRHQISADAEKKIVTAMIMSNDFIRNILPILDLDYFQGDYSKEVAKWCKDYYHKYDKAPAKDIQEVFNHNRGTLDEGTERATAEFLQRLSDAYDDSFNLDYYMDIAESYFRERDLVIRAAVTQALIERGQLDLAEQQFAGYKKIVRATGGWSDPFSQAEMSETMREEEDEVPFFTFPGKLGEFIGPLERGWFIGVMGPRKRGKTWQLQEVAIQGIIQRLRVTFISLEMKKKNINQRIYKRILAASEREGRFIYPAFDCAYNQDGTCNMPERSCRVPLLTGMGDDARKPQYDPNIESDYVPCDHCRRTGQRGYSKETWFVTYTRPKLELSPLLSRVKGIENMYGGSRLRVKAYPRFSATLSEIERDLDFLEYTEGFISDIIIIDYADIVRPEMMRTQTRDEINEIWMTLGGMAERRHALVFTGTQANRESDDARVLRQRHSADDIRKMAHIDKMLGLNQTPEEKREGIMRISKIADRHSDSFEDEVCTVLQQLSTGQVLLDSY